MTGQIIPQNTHSTTERPACGCQPGRWLCPVAEALWTSVTEAYYQVMTANVPWSEYDAAMAAFQKHVQVEK